MAYDVAFMSDEDLLKHVTATVNKNRFKMDLNSFNANIIDPIKLTFDATVDQNKL